MWNASAPRAVRGPCRRLCFAAVRPFGTYTDPVTTRPDAVVIVSDSHLGRSPRRDSDAAFHAFLRAVPDMGNHLVINGDLFEFWFEYRAVIPRAAFPTLAVLAAVRDAGVRLTVTGGNHDRWGGAFWREQLDCEFAAGGTETRLAGWRAFVHHGDGLSEQSRRSAIMHRVTKHPMTEGLFRWIHPDVGFWIVRHLYGVLREDEDDLPDVQPIADAQAAYARGLLASREDLDLVVLSHTHQRVIEQAAPRRWFLNPGAWRVDQRYAVVTDEGPELRSWT